ncbi:flagellar protein FliS [Sulfurimicrobium lacus]|uniref:Flagellar secretion chaperone FliS n=1 Tax=Sulfurimicrobium lacus TaxID=2715678 RepID=A0A6F8VCW0_9PROT|nr:flagellar export chaperone FliS [Sulfurimicrobium lacus]BCB26947.1 flagellar protein FliS [Sulfurimicrobium lacus]
MIATSRGALNAYSQVGVEASIASASPHKLISMLFDGAILAVSHGRLHMQQGNIAAKGASISKAIAIIDDGLSVSLDEKAGGELAQSLKALYEYMSNRLLMANLKNDVAGLDEVSRLLNELKSAWDSIEARPQTAAPSPVVDTAPQRSSISYGKA